MMLIKKKNWAVLEGTVSSWDRPRTFSGSPKCWLNSCGELKWSLLVPDPETLTELYKVSAWNPSLPVHSHQYVHRSSHLHCSNVMMTYFARVNTRILALLFFPPKVSTVSVASWTIALLLSLNRNNTLNTNEWLNPKPKRWGFNMWARPHEHSHYQKSHPDHGNSVRPQQILPLFWVYPQWLTTYEKNGKTPWL